MKCSKLKLSYVLYVYKLIIYLLGLFCLTFLKVKKINKWLIFAVLTKRLLYYSVVTLLWGDVL